MVILNVLSIFTVIINFTHYYGRISRDFVVLNIGDAEMLKNSDFLPFSVIHCVHLRSETRCIENGGPHFTGDEERTCFRISLASFSRYHPASRRATDRCSYAAINVQVFQSIELPRVEDGT